MHESVQALRPRCLENDYDYLAKIQTAIVSKNSLRLQYENAAQEASYREVEPIGLIFYSLNWHLDRLVLEAGGIPRFSGVAHSKTNFD